MSRRAWLAVAGVLFGALAISWLSWPAPPAPFRFDYPEGRRFTYRLEYQAHSELHPAAAGNSKVLSGSVDLGADLVLHGRGRAGTAQKVGLSFERLTRHQLVLFGQDTLADSATAEAGLLGHEALLELEPTGEVRNVSFLPEDPSLFKNLVQALVGELQVTVREGDQWSVAEPTQRGVASADYSVRASDAQRLELSKKRSGYQSFTGLGEMGPHPSLESRCEIVLERAGQLDSLTADERLSGGSRVSFELKLKRIDERADVAVVAAQSPRQTVPPAQVVPEPNAGHSLLEQQVDGLTPDALLANIRLYAAGGIIPHHNHFLIQATALLIQHPELCPVLAELFKDPAASLHGRAFVLDLLANAGSPQAQAAMCDALGSPAGRGDKAYNILFSRFALVRTPTAETVRFIDETYRSAPPEQRVTSAYALGATAGALHRQGHPEDAAPALARLNADLAAAKTPSEQSDLLLSLGNAGVPENLSTVLGYQHADSADVRSAAAIALRKTQTPEAEAALLALAADPEPKVQHEALQVLPRFSLDAAARKQLHDQVLAGAISMKSYNDLVTLLAPYLREDPLVAEVFRFLLTQDVVDRQVYTRIQTLLGPG